MSSTLNPFIGDDDEIGDSGLGSFDEMVDLSDIDDDGGKKKSKSPKEEYDSDSALDDLDDADDDDVSSSGDVDEDEDDDGEKPSKRGKTDEDREFLLRQIEELRAEQEREKRENLKRQASIAASSFGEKIEKADSDIARLKAIRSQARARGDWGAVDEADDLIEAANASKRDAANRLAQLGQFVQNLEKQGSTTKNIRAEEWTAKNRSWFNPSGNDEKSEYVRSLSAKLAAEGYDPKGEAHFKELDRRLKRRWPELYANKGGNGAFQGKPHVAGRGNSGVSSGKKGSNMLPKALLRLADQAGLDVNDVEVRKRLLRNYNETKKGAK